MSDRIWSAMMLARTLSTCEAILEGKPVLARNLDPIVLERALRGAPLPPAGDWIDITEEMLDSIVEAGSLDALR